jgi:hypothetical protein
MAQPKVLTCLHAPKLEAPPPPPPPLDTTLADRKQELELRMAYDIEESKNVRVKQMLREESIRSVKMQGLVRGCMAEAEERLRLKIARRQSRVSATRKLRQSLEWSCRSTVEGEAE